MKATAVKIAEIRDRIEFLSVASIPFDLGLVASAALLRSNGIIIEDLHIKRARYAAEQLSVGGKYKFNLFGIKSGNLYSNIYLELHWGRMRGRYGRYAGVEKVFLVGCKVKKCKTNLPRSGEAGCGDGLSYPRELLGEEYAVHE